MFAPTLVRQRDEGERHECADHGADRAAGESNQGRTRLAYDSLEVCLEEQQRDRQRDDVAPGSPVSSYGLLR